MKATDFGDLDHSGKVDVSDVVQCLKYTIGIDTLTPEAGYLLDVAPLNADGSFGDGNVDITDAVRLLRRVVGLEPDPWPHRRMIAILPQSITETQLVSALNTELRGPAVETAREAVGIPGSFTLTLAPDVSAQAVSDALTRVVAYSGGREEPQVLPDLDIQPAASPNDTDYLSGKQWHFGKIEAETAWDVTTGSPNVEIVVIDSGIDETHPDLSAQTEDYRIIKQSEGDENRKDVIGHGTEVAGSAAAQTDNTAGVAGMCWGCRVVAMKVTQPTSLVERLWQGRAEKYDVQAILDAIRQTIDLATRFPEKRFVINMSFGWGTEYVEPFETLLKEAHDKGIVIVASAGNEGVSIPSYPAAYPQCIAVGATDQDDSRSVWSRTGSSNFGSWVHVSAPGTGIYTTQEGGTYGSVNGTSFSSPIVAGLVGLILSKYPTMTPDEVRDALINGSDLIDPKNGSPVARRINAKKTFEYINSSRPGILIPCMLDLYQFNMASIPIVQPGPDGSVPPITTTDLPEGATIDSAGRFVWTPSMTQIGQYTVTFTVGIGDKVAKKSVNIEVHLGGIGSPVIGFGYTPTVRGKATQVDVFYTGPTRIKSLSMIVTFDPTLFEAVDGAGAEFATSIMDETHRNDYTFAPLGRIEVSTTSTSNAQPWGTLVSLFFRPKPNAPPCAFSPLGVDLNGGYLMEIDDPLHFYPDPMILNGKLITPEDEQTLPNLVK